MAPLNDGYGIDKFAGASAKATSPLFTTPPPTTVGSSSWYDWQKKRQPAGPGSSSPWGPWGSSTPGVNQRPVSTELDRRRSTYGTVNAGGTSGLGSGTPLRDPNWRGTPMRPVPPPPPENRGTPMRPVPEPNRGTPMRPVPDREAEAAAKKKAQEEAQAAEEARLRELFENLPALLPEQQLAYRTAVRDARRDFETMQNQIRLARRGARREYRQGVREVGRQQSGGSQDLATALAYLGMDTSPATMGVGLQDIERQSDLARSELARIKASALADTDMQMTQARIGMRQAVSAAEQAKLRAQAERATMKERFRLDNPEIFS